MPEGAACEREQHRAAQCPHISVRSCPFIYLCVCRWDQMGGGPFVIQVPQQKQCSTAPGGEAGPVQRAGPAGLRPACLPVPP